MLFKLPQPTPILQINKLIVEDVEIEYYYLFEKPTPLALFCRNGFNEGVLNRLKEIGIREVITTDFQTIIGLLEKEDDNLQTQHLVWRNYIYVNGLLGLIDTEYDETTPVT